MITDSYVRLEIFTSSGVPIEILLNENLKQGDVRTVVFSAYRYPHSAFMYRLTTTTGTESGIIMKTK